MAYVNTTVILPFTIWSPLWSLSIRFTKQNVVCIPQACYMLRQLWRMWYWVKVSNTKLLTEQVSVAVTVYTCKREVLSWNFGRNVGYLDWNFSWFSPVPWHKCRDIIIDQATNGSFQILSNSPIILFHVIPNTNSNDSNFSLPMILVLYSSCVQILLQNFLQ
jgi:hypothetical protein